MLNNLPKPLKKALSATLALAFWLGLWFILCKNVGTELLVPSPKSVLEKLCELFANKEFYSTVLYSFFGITKGYIIGLLSGAVLGAAVSFSDILGAIFKPFLTAVKTTPVVSFIILTLIWIEREYVPVFIAFLMVMPIIAAGVSAGISSADRELLTMAKAYKFSFIKKLKYIYLPCSVPSFASAAKTSIGLAWKAGIAAEVICMTAGTIGKAIKNSQVYLETSELFAWTAVIIIISLILEKLFAAVLDLILKRIIQKGGYFIEYSNK